MTDFEVLDIDMGSIRIVGTVPCGVPEHPFFDIEESEAQHFYEYAKLHPRLTYPIVAKGDSMIDAGIEDGFVVFLDASKNEAKDGDIILADHNGNRTLKRYRIHVTTHSTRVMLVAENPRYEPIIVEESDRFSVVGVVKGWYRNA